jgi:hypothetical protein
MRVSYDEGIASHIGPESCGGIREDAFEALTGVCAGWVSSLENFIRSADGVRPSEGNTGRIAIARFARTPRGLRPHARTQAPHKRRPSLRYRRLGLRIGSREIPGLAWMVIEARAVNPQGERRR